MLARALCIALTLELLLYAAVAVLGCDAGPAGAALIALGALLALRVAVVGLCYALAWAWHSPAPRLAPWPALRMVLGEYAAFVFSFVVLFPLARWTMPPDRLQAAARYRSTIRPPLLLVHGYGCSRAAWWFLRRRLEAAGWQVATISLEPVYTAIDAYLEPLARRIDAVLAATGGARLILVGHSMGGLVGRAYLQRFGAKRVAGLVTLATPHQGSRLAHLGFGENARQMLPESAWLAALASPDPQALQAAAVSTRVIYSSHDNMVLPQARLHWPGAQHRAVDGLGHLAMLYSSRVGEVLLEVFDEIGRGENRELER